MISSHKKVDKMLAQSFGSLPIELIHLIFSHFDFQVPTRFLSCCCCCCKHTHPGCRSCAFCPLCPLIKFYNSILLLLPMKVGEDNPQAREEEGKLSLLSTEHNSAPTGIPGMWGLGFHGQATAFTILVNGVKCWSRLFVILRRGYSQTSSRALHSFRKWAGLSSTFYLLVCIGGML